MGVVQWWGVAKGEVPARLPCPAVVHALPQRCGRRDMAACTSLQCMSAFSRCLPAGSSASMSSPSVRPQHACMAPPLGSMPWQHVAVCHDQASPLPCTGMAIVNAHDYNSPPPAAFQDEDLSLSLRELLRDGRGRVTVAAELLALVGGWVGGRPPPLGLEREHAWTCQGMDTRRCSCRRRS